LNSTQSVKQLRLHGYIPEAMKLASEALGKNPTDSQLMGETVRVLILAQEVDAASNLYQVFSSSGAGGNLEPEVLVRLAMQMGRVDLIQDMPPPEEGPAWLVHLLVDGEDPVGEIAPESVEIKVFNGPAVFNFQGCCPHCNHGLRAQVKVSLLIHRDWICPSCFGRVRLDQAGARNCLVRSFPQARQQQNIQADVDLIEYLRPKLMGVEPLPEIAMALGQEYQFLVNERVLANLNPEKNNGADQS